MSPTPLRAGSSPARCRPRATPADARHAEGMRRPGLLLSAVILACLACLAWLPGPAGAATVPDPVGVWPLRPAPPEVVARFDPPESTWGAGHRGVDLLGAPGQPVRTALSGTVSFVGTIAGRGVVSVDHGATRTTYEPVAATVDVGDPVTAGDPIGQLTYPGSHCAPRSCLHWGWLEGETYLDPLRLVGQGPVRLLPLDGVPVGAPATSPLAPAYDGWRPWWVRLAGAPGRTPIAAGPW